MDVHRIVQALQASLQPEQQAEAEKLLVEMHKIIGFAPTLVQIVLEQSLDLSVRQAGAVFLKNMILKSWKQREQSSPDEPIPFQIHENDKEAIRGVIVHAVVSSVIPIQSILQVAVGKILRSDFPSRYPNFVEHMARYLNTTDFRELHGALLCLYALVQVYEHKTTDKGPLPQTMSSLLPLLHQRMVTMLADTSDESLCLQKLVLKIFYRYTDFFLPVSSINEQWFTEWHVLFCSILQNFNGSNDDADSAYWKRQKWVARILYCLFTSYGSPGNVQKKYSNFADWYLKSFSNQVLTAFLKVCDAYRKQTFVSPKVMAETLSYLSASLSHAFSWKILQPNFDTLLQDVIVPLLSHSDELAEMWEHDPLEYIRYNTSMYMTLHNPGEAAAHFIKDACTKRKGILDKSMQYCIQVLTHNVKPQIKDGALHLVGTVCSTLLRNRDYKQQLESFMTTHVLPLFEAPEGYRRARACWLVGKLSRAKFNNVSILCQTALVCRHLMCSDPDLPVRVAAAKTVFSLMKDQDEVKKVMSAHLPELVMQLLKLLRETEFDDLNVVLRDVLIYYDEIQPISVQMLQHLSGTFVKLIGVQQNGEGLVSVAEGSAAGDLDYDETKEYQSLVATGVMENIESLMSVMEDNAELVANSEPVIVQLIQVILKNKVSDFYDEAFSLICSMTCTNVSPLLWSVFDWLYQAYETDAGDCFASMMPALHNYVTVDPKTFVASPERVKMLISMCRKSLQADDDQSTEGVHAAKMLEILTLNFRGQLDNCVPEFVELALTRLSRKTTIAELRVMCLEVVIAAIVTSAAIVLPILCNHMWPETQTPIIENVLKIWMDSIHEFSGLHDRRVCVLGLCTLLSLRADQRPPAVDAICAQYLPALLRVLTDLKNAYALKKEAEKEEESESDDDDDDLDEDGLADAAGEVADSDDDVIDEEGSRYLELLEAVTTKYLNCLSMGIPLL
uniref:Importin N-terminal domain-containing protein n=1 Tax=Mesocestoides corti TaxID=53468 RepID=A0A5K3EN74_MESCO